MESRPYPILSGLVTSCAAGVIALGSLLAEESRSVPLTIHTAVDRPVIRIDSPDPKVVIRIDIEGGECMAKKRMPLNLAIVLDHSGSMRGKKLEQAKQAASYLVEQLDPEDTVSVVLYDTEVEVIFPAAPVGDKVSRIQRLIRGVDAGGSTALHGGVQRGGEQLREFFDKERINRVILLSDGIANVGPSSNREIASLGTKLARRGMSVTTIGLGADYNETLLTALAEASDANYYYVADVEALPEVFREELGELKRVVAREIEIEIRCADGVRPIRFLGRPDRFDGVTGPVLHSLATLSSGQSRQIYLECVLDERMIGDEAGIADVSVRYRDAIESRELETSSGPLLVQFTEDEKAADAAIDREIAAEAALARNAEETEKAVALADKGATDASRAQIAQQRRDLESVLDGAPAPQRKAIEQEIANLDAAESDLGNGALSKEQRKVLTSGAWKVRNAK